MFLFEIIIIIRRRRRRNCEWFVFIFWFFSTGGVVWWNFQPTNVVLPPQKSTEQSWQWPGVNKWMVQIQCKKVERAYSWNNSFLLIKPMYIINRVGWCVDSWKHKHNFFCLAIVVMCCGLVRMTIPPKIKARIITTSRSHTFIYFCLVMWSYICSELFTFLEGDSYLKWSVSFNTYIFHMQEFSN